LISHFRVNNLSILKVVVFGMNFWKLWCNRTCSIKYLIPGHWKVTISIMEPMACRQGSAKICLSEMQIEQNDYYCKMC